MLQADGLWSSRPPEADAAFIAAAAIWLGDVEQEFLDKIWAGYERLRHSHPTFDGRDLERSITELLSQAIDDGIDGAAPYYVQHSPFERETMRPPPAQPPAYDLAFLWRANPRVMWPAEAKVLNSSDALADYLADIRDQYLTCRYAPFSGSGAMLGYLLAGQPADALENIASRLGEAFLEAEPLDPDRPHRSTIHPRTAPAGKPYPTTFRCHHLLMPFHGLSRHSA